MTLINSVDWESQLNDDEVVTKKEKGKEIRVVLLAGLRRLARIAGLSWSDCEIINPGPGMVQCIYRVRIDKVDWVGAADCNINNTDKFFINYPTAIAESRAEARCLRKALNINILSSEEIGFNDSSFEVSLDKKADSQLIKAIETLCKSKKIEIATVLESIIGDQERSMTVQLEDITVAEAQSAMQWLNKQKGKK